MKNLRDSTMSRILPHFPARAADAKRQLHLPWCINRGLASNWAYSNAAVFRSWIQCATEWRILLRYLITNLLPPRLRWLPDLIFLDSSWITRLGGGLGAPWSSSWINAHYRGWYLILHRRNMIFLRHWRARWSLVHLAIDHEVGWRRWRGGRSCGGREVVESVYCFYFISLKL
jgi:hypothetical protein